MERAQIDSAYWTGTAAITITWSPEQQAIWKDMTMMIGAWGDGVLRPVGHWWVRWVYFCNWNLNILRSHLTAQRWSAGVNVSARLRPSHLNIYCYPMDYVYRMESPNRNCRMTGNMEGCTITIVPVQQAWAVAFKTESHDVGIPSLDCHFFYYYRLFLFITWRLWMTMTTHSSWSKLHSVPTFLLKLLLGPLFWSFKVLYNPQYSLLW
jgi:hypothetical protein